MTLKIIPNTNHHIERSCEGQAAATQSKLIGSWEGASGTYTKPNQKDPERASAGSRPFEIELKSRAGCIHWGLKSAGGALGVLLVLICVGVRLPPSQLLLILICVSLFAPFPSALLPSTKPKVCMTLFD